MEHPNIRGLRVNDQEVSLIMQFEVYVVLDALVSGDLH